MCVRFRAVAVASLALLLTQCAPASSPSITDHAPPFAIGADVRIREALAALEAGDAEAAWFRFWELAQAGDPAAQVNLGRLYSEGLGIPAEPHVARRWIELAASSGHPLGQYRLGEIYETTAGGNDSRIELQAAALWYERAAEQGFEPASTAYMRVRQRLTQLAGNN